MNIPQSLLEGEMYNQVTTKGNKKQLEVLSPLIHQGQTIGVLKYTTVLTNVNKRLLKLLRLLFL